MCARVARFYGWTPKDIDDLDTYEVFKYCKAIDVISAQESLDRIRDCNFSDLKKESRDSVMSKLKRKSEDYGEDVLITPTEWYNRFYKGKLDGRR